MKTFAIISEYNPFHNGHLYMLNEAKKITNADYSIALMSGNFLQRGVPSVWDKYVRAKMCLENGIDLCLELPFAYATGSAFDFANGAVNILNSLNSIDYLIFGAETDDLELFQEATEILIEEPEAYRDTLLQLISEGNSYPAAQQRALSSFISESKTIELSKPNNTLALQYITAIKRINSNIKPVLIKRKAAMYHDDTIRGSISSATAVRTSVLSGNTYDIRADVPKNVFDIINSSTQVIEEYLTPFLQAGLINQVPSNICDMDNRIYNSVLKLYPVISYTKALQELTSKNYTQGRLARMLIHLLLNYTETDRIMFKKNGYAFYANVLGFNKNNSVLIRKINTESNIPLIIKNADFKKIISDYPNSIFSKRLWELDILASKLYSCLVLNSSGTLLPSEYEITPVIID